MLEIIRTLRQWLIRTGTHVVCRSNGLAANGALCCSLLFNSLPVTLQTAAATDADAAYSPATRTAQPRGEWLLILFVAAPDGVIEMRAVHHLGSAAHCQRQAEARAAALAAVGWKVLRHQCLRVGLAS